MNLLAKQSNNLLRVQKYCFYNWDSGEFMATYYKQSIKNSQLFQNIYKHFQDSLMLPFIESIFNYSHNISEIEI